MLPLQTEEPTTPQELIFQSTKSGAAEIPADAEMSHCSPKQRAALEDLTPRSHQTGIGRLRPPLPHRGFWGAMGAPSTGHAGLEGCAGHSSGLLAGLGARPASALGTNCSRGAGGVPFSNGVVICNSNGRCLGGSVYFLLSAG